jgi:hypothetical protein
MFVRRPNNFVLFGKSKQSIGGLFCSCYAMILMKKLWKGIGYGRSKI